MTLRELVSSVPAAMRTELAASRRFVVPAAGRAFTLASAASGASGSTLAVVPTERAARELFDDLRLFVDDVHQLTAWETLPFEHLSPSAATMAERASARAALAADRPGAVVVASVRSVSQRLAPGTAKPSWLAVGEDRDFGGLIDTLADLGYHRVDRVEQRGEFAVRGGIVDVFGASAADPVRIEFFGDTVESLRTFSVGSQRSLDPLDAVELPPAREFRLDDVIRRRAAELVTAEPWASETWERIANGISFPGVESWLPWLAPARTVLHGYTGRVFLFDPVRSRDRSRDLVKEESELAAALAPTWGPGAPEAGDHPPFYLEIDTEGLDLVEAPPVPAGPEDHGWDWRGFDASAGDPESVARAIARLRENGARVVIAMDGEAAAERVRARLAEEGLILDPTAIVAEGVHHGFVLPSAGIAVLGEEQIAGRRRAHRPVRRRARSEAAGYRDLEPGDHVVHHRHGIGRFEGLVTRSIAGVERDYLVVAYAGEDKLYVPTDQLAAVKKYVGGEAPRVSRMGGADWERTKSRVRKAVAAVAEHVVSMHRQRAQASGFAFSPDTPWQREMEQAFPFEETPDQLTALSEIKADMEAPGPMDRLLFGDVGFGKTEVAIRAAFKAVQDGTQVAVLSPTTLLAQQHFQTFSDRFAGYPVRVEMLSRFLSTKEQRSVVERLAAGEVDVVIGTHRLLSDDIVFRRLGLVVVDEEQRFGVAAKDRLKQFTVGVDVLTLTATPIPRTLEMALTGVRNVSHIRTPPVDRHPILTFVGPYDELSVSAAIRRELLREGQVFYVHNRVRSIDRAVARLRELVPDARYAVAHGQMSEGQLEQVMLDFWNREYDVLVATTIIESGLDLPQVNTLIVERADLLGLAQLYQLRGRVGRSDQRAYAYLFHPSEHSLSEEAFRRLEAIGEHTDLGSGFELAMRDLEIRGAGSMLGEVQSGHIASVGFDLYCQLVAEAVGELEGLPAPAADEPELRIELPVDAHLPHEYVPDQDARIEAYRRLASAATSADVDDVAAEWRDRFGEPPPMAESLLAVARLRADARRVGLTEIVKLRREVRLGPVDLTASQEVRLQRLARGAVLRPDEGTLFLPEPEDDLVAALRSFLAAMWPDD